MIRRLNLSWLTALLLGLLACGCASLDTDNSASKAWDDPSHYSTPGDWMMKPIVEPPSYGP
jgi:hypothetical protein